MSLMLALLLASDAPLADPTREAQARALMADIRCLVCQGQSIADSDADLARDMRLLVRERIAAGEQPRAVRDWLVARYGDQISYVPPFDARTLLLWLAPVLVLAGGGRLARSAFRRRR